MIVPDAGSDRSALSLIFDPLPIFTTRFSLPDVLKHARGLQCSSSIWARSLIKAKEHADKK
jgi:hypothetical protein